jgi:hypothetical protein
MDKKMKEKILLTVKDCKDIIKDEVRRENFYFRYGKVFHYPYTKLYLTYEQWKEKGGSVRKLMQDERDKRMEARRKKLYVKGGYVPLNTVGRKKRIKLIKCDQAKEKMNEIQKKYNKKYGLENYKYCDPTKRKK